MKGKIVVILSVIVASIDISSAQVLLKPAGNITDQYLVYFTNSIDITTRIKKEKSRAFKYFRIKQQENIDLLKFELADTDLKIKRSLWIKQSAAITISSQYLERLNALPFVSNVNADKKYKIDTLGTTTLVLPSDELVQNNLFDIGVESVWNAGFKGQGVVVAIIDSGVDIDHATLKSRWRGGTNSWFDPVNGSVEPSDFSGHGTAVASIVLGGNENKTGAFLGVAPNAQWIAAKIFSSSVNGATLNSSISAIQEALQWVLDPDGDSTTDDYPDIVQNSWGMAGTEGSCTNIDFNDSLDAINALGIDIVFAVGNSGPVASSRLAPSYHADVISVGAVDTFNSSVETILSSSSRGPNLCENVLLPSLMAPGIDIVAAEKSLGSVSAIRNTGENTGTSFSSPHVSGAIALLRSQFDSSVDYLKFRKALFNSAKDLGATGSDTDFGNGLVRVDEAMTLLLNENTDRMDNNIIFSTAKYVFNEDELSVEVNLLRTGDISTDQSTRVISENGTASSGTDFVSVSTDVEFLAGESSKIINIELLNDAVSENTESFNLIISTNNFRKKISIIDNDNKTEEEEDVIGGSATGVFQLLLFVMLWFGRRYLR